VVSPGTGKQRRGSLANSTQGSRSEHVIDVGRVGGRGADFLSSSFINLKKLEHPGVQGALDRSGYPADKPTERLGIGSFRKCSRNYTPEPLKVMKVLDNIVAEFVQGKLSRLDFTNEGMCENLFPYPQSILTQRLGKTLSHFYPLSLYPKQVDDVPQNS
jgi:hypothetical protein